MSSERSPHHSRTLSLMNEQSPNSFELIMHVELLVFFSPALVNSAESRVMITISPSMSFKLWGFGVALFEYVLHGFFEPFLVYFKRARSGNEIVDTSSFAWF